MSRCSPGCGPAAHVVPVFGGRRGDRPPARSRVVVRGGKTQCGRGRRCLSRSSRKPWCSNCGEPTVGVFGMSCCARWPPSFRCRGGCVETACHGRRRPRRGYGETRTGRWSLPTTERAAPVEKGGGLGVPAGLQRPRAIAVRWARRRTYLSSGARAGSTAHHSEPGGGTGRKWWVRLERGFLAFGRRRPAEPRDRRRLRAVSTARLAPTCAMTSRLRRWLL